MVKSAADTATLKNKASHAKVKEALKQMEEIEKSILDASEAIKNAKSDRDAAKQKLDAAKQNGKKKETIDQLETQLQAQKDKVGAILAKQKSTKDQKDKQQKKILELKRAEANVAADMLKKKNDASKKAATLQQEHSKERDA